MTTQTQGYLCTLTFHSSVVKSLAGQALTPVFIFMGMYLKAYFW